MMSVLRMPQSRQRERCLAAKVKAHLLTRDELDIHALVVRVKAGVVLLRGLVPSRRQKVLAGAIARRVHGVVGVFNQLAVVGPGSTRCPQS